MRNFTLAFIVVCACAAAAFAQHGRLPPSTMPQPSPSPSPRPGEGDGDGTVEGGNRPCCAEAEAAHAHTAMRAHITFRMIVSTRRRFMAEYCIGLAARRKPRARAGSRRGMDTIRYGVAFQHTPKPPRP